MRPLLRPSWSFGWETLRTLRTVPAWAVPLVLWPALGLAADWELLGTERGVRVETREVAGSDLPEFRGTTTMPFDIYEIAAVLDDLNHFCDWNQRCVSTRELARDDELHRIFYTRTGAPWPVQDRDAVLRGEVTGLAEGNDVMVKFWSIRDPRWPAKSGAVRMPKVKGHWRMWRVGPNQTKVEYQVLADPGGLVPAWAARRTARDVPRDTLAGLRRHIPKVRSKYEAYVNRWRKPAPPAATPAAP